MPSTFWFSRKIMQYKPDCVVIAPENVCIAPQTLTPRLFKLVTEWAALYQAELMEDWELARDNQTFNKICPLV